MKLEKIIAWVTTVYIVLLIGLVVLVARRDAKALDAAGSIVIKATIPERILRLVR